MAENVIVSKKGSLKWRDALRALLLAVMSAVVPVIVATLESGSLQFNWKAIGITALSTASAYILKNWLIEPAQVTTIYASNEDAEIVGENIKNDASKG